MDEQPPDAMSKDLEEARKLVKEMSDSASDVTRTVEDLMTRFKNGEFKSDKGISLLDVKNHMMLEYLTNLSYIIMKKVSGKQIENDPAIERLVESRVVLERIKPIEQRLNYQIQKLITAAKTGTVRADDPLRFRPNPANMLMDDDDDDDDEGKEKTDLEAAGSSSLKTPKSNKYVPPRITPVFYDGDETDKTRRDKQLDQAKKRALNSTILQELKREYDTGPEEIREYTDTHRQKIEKEIKERERYEEEHMMRIPLTKKQQHEAKKVMTMSSLSSIAKFDDISALDLNPEAIPLKRKKNANKKFTTKKGKGKRKSFKRRKH